VSVIRRRALALFVPLALVVLIAGCSSSDDAAEGGSSSSTTTEAADSSTTTEATDAETSTTEATDAAEVSADDAAEICDALQPLSDYDAASAAVVATGDWAAVQQFFIESTQPVIAAYDQAIAVGSDLSADLTQLRDVTSGTSELAAQSSDLMDFAGRLGALPGIIEAGEAGLRLNTFAEANCGFSTGGGN
jgi:hypothetical protein